MADCVTVNRAPDVIAAFKEFGIEVYPSNGRGHYVRGGQAPYSHETNHENGSMLGTFQDDLAKRMRDLDSIATHTRVAQLYEEIPKLWRSAKYRRMAVKAGNSFAGICGAIRTKKGAPTRR